MPEDIDPAEDEENELTPEQITELKEKASRVDELEGTLKEKEEELGKLESKDFNFRKFEKAKKEEQEQMTKDFSEKEKLLVGYMSNIKAIFSASEYARLDEDKKSILELIVADEDLTKRLEDAVKHSIAFLGEPKTPSEVNERYQRAYSTLKESTTVNPLNQFAPVTGSHTAPSGKKTRFTDTPEGKALFKKKFGIDLDEKKKE